MTVVPEELRWRPDLTSRQVDEKRVVDIAWVPMDPRVRNQLITRTYGDLAQAMAHVVGTNDTTWAGFGLWASDTIAGYLAVPIPIPGLKQVITRSFGDGNRDVFADIGRAHTTFLDTVGNAVLSKGDHHAAWKACERRLRERVHAPAGEPRADFDAAFWFKPLDPRLEPPGEDHNQLLVAGFRAYYRSIDASTPEQRSQSILLGNCMLALHEQKLLSLAISTGFRGWVRTATTFWRSFENRASWRLRAPGKVRLAIEHWWIHMATRFLVGIALPDRKVKCGKPVPDGANPVEVPAWSLPEGMRRPAALSERTDLDILGEMFHVFRVDGRPATCWSDLGDRMAYIMGLFAEHQRAPGWLDEHQRPLRPDHWDKFEQKLASEVARLEHEPPSSIRGTEERSPLSDEQLDSLRLKNSYVSIRDLQGMTLPDAAEAEDIPGTLPVRVDQKQRYLEAVRAGGVLDPVICRSARATFQRFPTLWYMGLLLRSLPDGYSSATGVHAIGRISDVASEPFRRAGETAQFVQDLLVSDDGWHDGELVYGGDAFTSILGVRTIHSMVADWLYADGWPTKDFGRPMNVEDVLGAALTFGVSSIELIDSIDPTLLSDQERDNYAQFWLGIGYLLGASIESVTTGSRDRSLRSDREPLAYGQAQALAVRIQDRHRARSLDGVRLNESLTEGVADGFPRPLWWLAPGLMQTLGEPQVTDALLAGTGTGRRRSALIARTIRFMLRTRLLRPLARWFIRRAGQKWIQPFLEQGRSYPYRRQVKPSDLERLDVHGTDAELWPTTCSQLEAERSPTPPDLRSTGDPRRRPAA